MAHGNDDCAERVRTHFQLSPRVNEFSTLFYDFDDHQFIISSPEGPPGVMRLLVTKKVSAAADPARSIVTSTMAGTKGAERTAITLCLLSIVVDPFGRQRSRVAYVLWLARFLCVRGD